MSSTAISAVSGVLEENGTTGFHFVIVNIDGTGVVGSVLFQYVVPRLTSVPENRIIQAYVCKSNLLMCQFLSYLLLSSLSNVQWWSDSDHHWC